MAADAGLVSVSVDHTSREALADSLRDLALTGDSWGHLQARLYAVCYGSPGLKERQILSDLQGAAIEYQTAAAAYLRVVAPKRPPTRILGQG